MRKIPYKKSPGVIASVALITLLAVGGVDYYTAQQSAQLAVDTVEQFEGYVPEAYQDPVGIWTKCYGDTRDVVPGAKYSYDECARSLNEHLAELSAPVLRCVPSLRHQPPRVIAAFLSMTYNIGSGAFCKSSVARAANTGDYEYACRRIARIYKTARGVELPGLVKRRNMESQMCLEGLKEGR